MLELTVGSSLYADLDDLILPETMHSHARSAILNENVFHEPV